MALELSNPTTNLTKIRNTLVDVNTGNASEGTQRVILATNQPTISVSLTGSTSDVNVQQVYIQDSAAASGASLFVAGAVREDTLAAGSLVSGDYTWLKTNQLGRLYTSATIDASIPAGSNTIGQVNLNAGSNTIGKIDINQVYIEDATAPAAGGQSLFLAGAIRQDNIATTTTADGNYSNLKVNSTGRLYTLATLDAALPTGTNIIGKVNLLQGTSGNEINIRNKADSIASITSIQITGPSGQFSCAPTNSIMIVGQFITLSGTVNSGSISGYNSPTTYKISATNGSNTFTLINLNNSSLTTTAGGITSLTGSAASLETALVTSLRDSLPEGYNVIGKLAPNSGINIGTVDANILNGVTVSGNLSTITSITTANLAADDLHDGVAGTTVVMNGGFANSTAPTAVADGDAARLWTTLNGALHVADAGGSLTVDAPVTTPVHVRLSDGTSVINTLPVSLVTGTNSIGNVGLNAGTNAIGKLAANDGVDIGDVSIKDINILLNNTTTSALANALVIKAGAGNLYMLNGYNNHSSPQFIQIHNTSSVPLQGATPILTFIVPPNSNFSFDWGVYGRRFNTGITVTNSSTLSSLTIGLPNCWFDAQTS
jgi:hypothetical protein